jgi:hypothetical protein
MIKMPYGLANYSQVAPLSPPLQQHGTSLIQHMGSSALVPVSGSNGSASSINSSIQTGTTTIYRGSQYEEKRLTRDAMERYLRDRNDMIIVILHAKVITDI